MKGLMKLKVTCTKLEMGEAINAVSRAVLSKASYSEPLLTGIYMRAEGSRLTEEAMNEKLSIRTTIPVNTEKPGAIVVNGKYLQEVHRKLTGDIISIMYDEEAKTVTIQSETIAFKLLAMNAEDWLRIEEPDSVVKFKMPVLVLKNLIRKTMYACSNDDSRPMFTGCLLEIKDKKVTMVGTDTHRIAIMKDDIYDDIGEMKYIIPSKALSELLRQSDESNGNEAVISCSADEIAFEFDNVYMKTRMLEGEFPRYEKVIPREATVTARLETSELLAAIDRVGLIAKETEYKTIRCKFADGQLELSSTSPEIGNAEESIAAQIDGGKMDISFNVNYLSDALKVIDTKICVIRMTESLKPAEIREADSDDYIYVVTPIRTV